MKAKKVLILGLLLCLKFSGYCQSPIQQLALEDDWSLPSWVTPSPNSGISFFGNKPIAYPEPNIKLVTFRWKDVSPTDGTYNWSILQSELALNQQIILRLEVSDSIHVPQWLFTKYPNLKNNVFLLTPYEDNFEIPSPGKFIPLWHVGVEMELNKLLLNFKAQNFGQNPRLHSAYFPGGWKWGEFARPDDAVLVAQGLTPTTYLAWFKRMTDSYIDAFNGNAYKLIFTGGDIIENDGIPAWRTGVGRIPTEYVIQRGCGARTGLLEKFNFIMTDLPNYGTSIVTIADKNYMVTDDTNPLISDTNRIWANENEEFCYSNNPCNIYHYKMSVLKQLQLRQNWMYSNQRNWAIDIPLNMYFYKTAGKKVSDSPDAWCALREAEDIYQYWANFPNRQNFAISNFERWLTQREIAPDGITNRTYVNVDNAANMRLFNGDSYEAKITTRATGGNYIYFNVDDKFIKNGTNDVQVKVTFLDNFAGNWELQYDGNLSSTQQKINTNANDGKWKTVTFNITDAKFNNSQTGGMDFRIYNGGTNDITVRFVRVVKNIKPIPLPITLTTFAAKKQPNTNLITWQTSTETNNNIFELERSIDGKNFTIINTQKSKGNSRSNQIYGYNDNQITANTVYYRLKQTDFDGKFSHSKIISLKADFESKLSVYPNPFSNQINISASKNIASLKIISASGKTIVSQTVNQKNYVLAQADLNIETYILVVVYTDGSKERVKLIKQ